MSHSGVNVLRRQPPACRTAGLDEAGRGCLAGPVVAAAVVLPDAFNLQGLGDSKKISAASRERLRTEIRGTALAWSIGVIWPRRIDEVNILNASLEAMARAAASLRGCAEHLLVDGNMTIPAAILKRHWPEHCALPDQAAIIRGDALVPAISAASIIAKTYRDRLMASLARRWPGYGFEKHKGYGTRRHMDALRLMGPCPMHRRTFRGVLQQDAAQCELPAAP